MDKKKTFFIITGILIFGTLLRLININKPEGMWNDEYLTWEIAKAAFPYEFFKGIINNCHAPLHYIYLKLWMLAFGDSDISLRVSSLVPGVLSIIVTFFIGCKIGSKGKKKSYAAGLFAAFLTSISAFMIYFSQEVRIYSLLYLLSAINIYTAIKTMENPSKKNCIFFVLSSLLVMLQHTIGFVFVFFSALSVILFADAPKKSKFKKYLLTAFCVALVLFIPIGIFLYNVMFNQQYWSQWWAPFSIAKAGFFFSDVFSPYLINITNAPPSFFGMIYQNGEINFGFILFVMVPLLIGAVCSIKTLLKPDRNIKYFVLTFLGVYLTVFTASIFEKIVFLTKYMTEIIPILILLFALGLASIKSKGIKISLITVYSVISIFFIFASDFSPVKLIRQEGQNIPVVLLKQLDYKPKDKVLLLYYPKKRFAKYSKELTQNKNTSHISKYDFTFINGAPKPTSEVFKNGKKEYRNMFLADKNNSLDVFLNNNIYSTIKSGEKFYLVDLSSVSFIPAAFIKKIASDDNQYNNMPFLYLIFSYVKNYVIDDAKQRLAFSDVIKQAGWTIYVFEKT